MAFGGLRLAAAIVAGAGAGLLVAAVVDLRPDRSAPAPFGVTAPAAVSSTRPAAQSGPAGTPAPGAGVPVTLTIPALQVRASVVPVVSTSGILGVPDDPSQVGWWSASAPAGAPRGSVVIDGHVDSAVSGPGALFHLDALRPTDRIVLTTGAGAVRSYTVTGRRVYRKAAGLPADIFDQLGAPRLVLISCGGPFDAADRSYLDNIVVFAAPG